jgi:Tol biopolymer transport system component
MSDSPPTTSPSQAQRTPADRLESWKEIAAYLRRDVTTVQRWEKREGMPVHRHQHDKMGSVYAFRADLDAWARSRSPVVGSSERDDEPAQADGAEAPGIAARRARRRVGARWLGAAGAVAVAALAVWQVARREAAPENPLANARFLPLTDFDGVEQAAAISRDGRFVAFQSDRDGRMDVWLTQIGTGRFTNLTRGSGRELVNPSVRTLGFSPDGAVVTYWARAATGAGAPDIGVWAAPLLGGPSRPYLEGVAEFDWSSDGTRLVYHTPGPGDPTYVREAGEAADAHMIFQAPAGLHAHFPIWSPDRSFVYFVQGSIPDQLDVWRIRSSGGAPERLTHHDALVSHPVFVDARTLLYLSTDPDRSGPWIHALDVETGVSRRVGLGMESYTSLSASADGERIVATRASPKRTLWSVPVDGSRAEMAALRRIPLTTGNGTTPRVGPGYLLYVSSKGTTDGLWKLQDAMATEVWSAPEARIVGAPAIDRNGRRVAFTVRQGAQTMVIVVNADGTDARVVTRALVPQGDPAWAPDGRSITVAGAVNGTPRLFHVPLDGASPVQLVSEHALDPAWSPRGDVVVFSGADVGTTFPVKAAKADGSALEIPPLTLTRGARHLAFAPTGREVLVLRGGIRHKNVWLVDLDSGAERQVTDLAPDFEVRDFDVSPDGRELVLERVQEHSDVVLIELPRR